MYLFCIPYAGGSAHSYSLWKKSIRDDIKIIPIELPGRGEFLDKQNYKTVQEAAEDIFNQISDKLNSTYAIWGHSMGGLIAYELTKYISTKRGYKLPCNIFISGREAPDCSRVRTKEYPLSEEESQKILIKFSPDIKNYINNKFMYEYIEGLLIEDLKLMSNYKIEKTIIPVDTDITVIVGDMDYLTTKDIIEWKKYTTRDCKIRIFKGGHFYFRENFEDLIEFIEEVCKKYL